MWLRVLNRCCCSRCAVYRSMRCLGCDWSSSSSNNPIYSCFLEALESLLKLDTSTHTVPNTRPSGRCICTVKQARAAGPTPCLLFVMQRARTKCTQCTW